MNDSSSSLTASFSLIEPLEQRIAPAVLLGSQFVSGTGEILLKAGTDHAGLSTSVGDPVFGGGSYLLYVTKGYCKVFTTDLNHNGRLDANEITGISAGPGLRLLAFTDIHGDIVTNLNPDGTLTDSDNNASNGRDGRVLLPNTIEQITMRSLTAADLPTPDANHSTLLTDRLALTSYSIFGNIYAGGGFGAKDGGLTIDTSGSGLLATKFSGDTGVTKYIPTTPEIGSIKVGTAASGQYFNFRTTGADTVGGGANQDVRGQLAPFIARAGVNGADIIGIGAASSDMAFNLGTLQAGDGGFNGRGGNIVNVAVTGDMAGGYKLIAGNAGAGQIGQAGGSILNYSDQGSVTGDVLIKSGNGGKGLVGAGGAAGVVNFDPTKPQNVSGHVQITLGNGGDGFRNGGNGGSLPGAAITVPEGGIPTAVTVVSTMHTPGSIGSTQSFDFNGTDDDAAGRLHYSDAVYTTSTPGDIVVMFGDIFGFDPHQTIHLNGPANAQVVVADFNGDGHPDIAAASGKASNAGITVFLSQYDALGRFTGFSDALHTALPSLTAFGYFESSFPITKLAAGDFDGDGAVDLAFLSTQNPIPNTGSQPQLLTILRGATDSAHAHGTGYFFADFSNPTGKPFTSFSDVSGNFPILKATALKQGDAKDVLLAGYEGDKSFFVATYTAQNLTAHAVSLGQVDTNRNLNTKTNPPDQQSLQDVTLRDFTILDLDGDNNADVVALSKAPDGFLQTFKGDGLGGFPIGSTGQPVGGNAATPPDNSGIKLTGDDGLGLKNTNFVGILSVNADNDSTGKVNDIALVDYRTDTSGPRFQEIILPSFTGAGATVGNAHVMPYGTQPSPVIPAGDPSIRAFDVYTPLPSLLPGMVGYVAGSPYKDNPKFHAFTLTGDGGLYDALDLTNNGVFVTAGHGGNSLLGIGGAGGSIGTGVLVNKTSSGTGDTGDITRLTGGFDILLPANTAYRGTIRIVAGDGGQGFLRGGAGGTLSGISVDYANAKVVTSTVALFAGRGGDGLAGVGGAGGNLNRVHVVTGSIFASGDGGSGIIGGTGGNIVGNNFVGAGDAIVAASDAGPDLIQSNSADPHLLVHAGTGGVGQRAGGAGGSIIGFAPQFIATTNGETGLLHYTAGDGGQSVAGVGGRGGAVLNSTPIESGNSLVGDIFIQSGRGGDGAIGGAGGNIAGFQNSPGVGSLPLSLSVLAGNGGNGTIGSGGAGGSIANIRASSTGHGYLYHFDFSHPETVLGYSDVYVDSVPLDINRIIAGTGGHGGGGNGGAGGSVVGVHSGAASSAFVTAAGRGGDGLLNGGAGGYLNDVHLTANPTSGKVLFVAGDGGDTFGSLPPPNATPQQALHAFGGRFGFGGKGGTINNVSQDGSSGVNVDLVAGSGGSTINFGTAADLRPHVGLGGSVLNVRIAGNIGNSDPNVPIKSYNNVAAGERMSDVIANRFLTEPIGTLDDTVGNVGLVAGAAGRVRDNNHDGILDPTSFAANGIVANVAAQNIMSAVAGSVDRIASIQAISNVRVTTTGGIFGADKADPGNGGALGTKDYLMPDGTETHDRPYIGGALIDGAIVAKNARPLQSDRDFILQ